MNKRLRRALSTNIQGFWSKSMSVTKLTIFSLVAFVEALHVTKHVFLVSLTAVAVAFSKYTLETRKTAFLSRTISFLMFKINYLCESQLVSLMIDFFDGEGTFFICWKQNFNLFDCWCFPECLWTCELWPKILHFVRLKFSLLLPAWTKDYGSSDIFSTKSAYFLN